MTKTPTLEEKVEMYEKFLHKINMGVICMSESVSELVSNADRWSYAHRVGNGELSDEEQQELVDKAFWKLCDTPKADEATKIRQKAYAEYQKKKEQQ